MKLQEVIVNCLKFEDTDEFMHQVFAQKINGKFEPSSQAVVLKLTLEEMEMNLAAISMAKCPGFDYFLELFILQDLFQDLINQNNEKSNDEKVKIIIQYAEFDA